jgi:LemA protein
MKKKFFLYLIFVFIFIIVFGGIVIILNYNGIVKAEKAVEEAKSQVEVVCQRRLDLIPNLVETVKGYARYEKETLLAITNARSNAQGILEKIGKKQSLGKEDLAALTASQSELTRTLKSLFALIENYPDLKASSNFLALQDQLEGTENRISITRQRYNSGVRYYNTKIATFPRTIVASMFDFKQKDYFEASKEAKEPAKVKF